MKKSMLVKTICISLVLCIIVGLCGCSASTASARPVVLGKEGAQYVIALNPSIGFTDSTVNSIRNSLSSSLQKDVSSGKAESLYGSTQWRWLTHGSDGAWNTRKLRAVTMWMNSEGLTNNGVPYVYTVTDSGLSSLAVFDSRKMDVKGVNEGEIPENGVIMSFTGEAEEGITFIADRDCIVELADRGTGKVSVVSSISGLGTDFTALEGAKKAIILRIYKNNRIYWQEVLESGTTSVSFPTFSDIELKTGDTISITAQATDDTSSIIRGNCDLPAKTTIVTEKVPVENKEEIVEINGIPFVTNGECQFTILRSKDASPNEIQVIKKLYEGMTQNLATDVAYKNDEVDPIGRKILVQSVNDPQAKKALEEVKKGRKENYSDFIIRLVGDDIVIVAASNMALEVAIDFFINNYCTSFDSELPLKLDYVSSKYNPIKKITFAGNAISKYRIVVSSYASVMETKVAEQLVREIALLCGFEMPIVEDTKTSKQDFEILIGDTNRANYRGVAEQSKVNLDAANVVDATKSSYEIKIDSKNVSILADHVSGVNAGVLKFISQLKSKVTFEKGTTKGNYNGEYSLIDGYKLTFADEFDGDTLKKYWTIYGIGGEITTNWTGGTTRTKLPKVKDGNLVNTVSWTRKDNGAIDIDKAEIASKGKNTMNFMWGYLEVRIKFSKLHGFTHSMFTQGPVAGGFLESNIIETFGNPYNSKFNMHSWTSSGHINHNATGSTANTILNNSPGISSGDDPFGENYHTFGWEWTDNWSQFYCDGKKTWYMEHSTPNFNLFDKPAWLILSFRSAYYAGGSQTSGYGGAGLEKNPFFMNNMDYLSDAALIDYVHIYQKDDGSVMYIKP